MPAKRTYLAVGLITAAITALLLTAGCADRNPARFTLANLTNTKLEGWTITTAAGSEDLGVIDGGSTTMWEIPSDRDVVLVDPNGLEYPLTEPGSQMPEFGYSVVVERIGENGSVEGTFSLSDGDGEPPYSKVLEPLPLGSE